MIDMIALASKMEDDISGVNAWTDKLYDKYFGQFFHVQKDLYMRMQSTSQPITDTELEKVLTELPLELIAVSEALSKFQIGQEVIKLRTKESDPGSKEKLENELMTKVYSAVTERVSRQITFSKELIMSCKKIWDRRKDTESVVPIGTSVDGSLPEYTPPTMPSTYIG